VHSKHLHFVRPKSNSRVIGIPPRDNIQEEFTAHNRKSTPATHSTKQFHDDSSTALGAVKLVVCSLTADSAIWTANTNLSRLTTRSQTPVFNCAHCRSISAKHAHTNQEPSNIHQHCKTVLTLLNKKTGLNWQQCTMTSIRRCQHAGVSRQLVGTSVFRISTCNVVCCFIYQGLWTFER
jgi:hypothetical protein